MKQLGHVFLAAALAVTIVAPTPAAPAARRASLHRVSRFRGVPTFADSTLADIGTFDDPIVRAAAVEGLGRYNGAVVAVDPNTGRILTVVNQKIAFGAGYIPCSTIKPTVALAALEENVITRDTMLKVGRRKYMNLTEAMAHSNNVFFEELGRRMGFDTVSRYARLLGLGELAGYNLPEEHPGSFPMQPPAHGGIARMSSFGEGIQITPLQLASLAAAFANGGTLYYLQYPRTADEVQNFAPRVKRDLNIATVLPEIRNALQLLRDGDLQMMPRQPLVIGHRLRRRQRTLSIVVGVHEEDPRPLAIRRALLVVSGGLVLRQIIGDRLHLERRLGQPAE